MRIKKNTILYYIICFLTQCSWFILYLSTFTPVYYSYKYTCYPLYNRPEPMYLRWKYLCTLAYIQHKNCWKYMTLCPVSDRSSLFWAISSTNNSLNSINIMYDIESHMHHFYLAIMSICNVRQKTENYWGIDACSSSQFMYTCKIWALLLKNWQKNINMYEIKYKYYIFMEVAECMKGVACLFFLSTWFHLQLGFTPVLFCSY